MPFYKLEILEAVKVNDKMFTPAVDPHDKDNICFTVEIICKECLRVEQWLASNYVVDLDGGAWTIDHLEAGEMTFYSSAHIELSLALKDALASDNMESEFWFKY